MSKIDPQQGVNLPSNPLVNIVKGADVNAKCQDGTAALHIAIEKGQKDVVEQLIAAGADVKTRNGKGRTPPHLAAEHSRKDLVELLLPVGSDVNAEDQKYGATPLNCAI